MPDILNRTFVPRDYFDPTNPEHVESFKTFVRTGNWGDIQFHAELPYIEVPITVLMKFALHQLNTQKETQEEREARLASKNLVAPSKTETRAEQRKRLEAANIRIMDQIRIEAFRNLSDDEEA